jgi:multimeric flavodoxin WrbA
MKILNLVGSSRKDGNTKIITDRILNGLEVSTIYLYDYKIEPIIDKRHTPEGFDTIGDDYETLIREFLKHEIIFFSTPLYWFGMTGQMKLFFDRWSQSLRNTYFDLKAELSKKKAYVVIVGGDQPNIEALPLIQQFKLIFDYVGMDFTDYIIGKANKPGEIMADQQALIKASLWNDQLKQV